jgi:2-polyprenyl-3-methyl-5-hydroxy-6-metoxy-1,4-benzoquinol methylase
MDQKAQAKWDRIYGDAQIGEQTPCSLLAENNHLLPKKGLALDLACGLGGNSLALIDHGLSVDAWDISPVVVSKLNHYAELHHIALNAQACDLANSDLGKEKYDVILVAHYLERSLAPAIMQALKPGGLLCYQTFVRDTTDDYSGPSNPDFLLKEGELLQLFSELRPIFYREEGTLGNTQRGVRNLAQLIARKPA